MNVFLLLKISCHNHQLLLTVFHAAHRFMFEGNMFRWSHYKALFVDLHASRIYGFKDLLVLMHGVVDVNNTGGECGRFGNDAEYFSCNLRMKFKLWYLLQ